MPDLEMEILSENILMLTGSGTVQYPITAKTPEEFNKWKDVIQEMVDLKEQFENCLENPQ